MKKIRLDLEKLEVTSFDAGASGEHGTVHARSIVTDGDMTCMLHCSDECDHWVTYEFDSCNCPMSPACSKDFC